MLHVVGAAEQVRVVAFDGLRPPDRVLALTASWKTTEPGAESSPIWRIRSSVSRNRELYMSCPSRIHTVGTAASKECRGELQIAHAPRSVKSVATVVREATPIFSSATSGSLMSKVVG